MCGKRGGKATENSVDTVKRNACSVCLLQAAGPLFVCPCQSKGPLFSEIFYLKDSPIWVEFSSFFSEEVIVRELFAWGLLITVIDRASWKTRTALKVFLLIQPIYNTGVLYSVEFTHLMLIPLDKSFIPSLLLTLPFSYELSCLVLFREIILLENSWRVAETVISFCWGLCELLKNWISVVAWDSQSPQLCTLVVVSTFLAKKSAYHVWADAEHLTLHFLLEFQFVIFCLQLSISKDLFMITPPSSSAAAAHLIKAVSISFTSLMKVLQD